VTPAFAVTIPAHGDGVLLREAVASVLAQDSDDWTLSVHDDGPDDAGLTDWFAGLDARVSYRRNDPRLGINRNFQHCLETADADLVTIMGADDRMLPSYVRVMCAAAQACPEAGWLHPRVQVIDADGDPDTTAADRVKARLSIEPPALVGGEQLAVSLLRGNWRYFPAVTFRTAAARSHGFRPGHDIVLDLDLYLRMLLAGERALLVDSLCFEYRRHGASLSSTQRWTGDRFAEERRYFRQVAAELDLAGWHHASRAARVHLMSRLHAASLVPGAAAARELRGSALLLRHVLFG
jgi:glycosyltransferase involved in cell wall biosynthesis